MGRRASLRHSAETLPKLPRGRGLNHHKPPNKKPPQGWSFICCRGRESAPKSVLALEISPYALHMGQQVHKKRMATKRGRIADQQQLAPCAGHAHVHASDVGEEADLALGVATCQCDGNDVSLLALKRIDGAHAEPASQQQVVEHSAVFDGVFQIIDLGAVRCNHANGQRSM